MARPKNVNSAAEKELDKVEAQFKEFDNQVKEMTLDRMRAAPKEDLEEQTKISSKELERKKEIYLKPSRTIGSKEKFNEKYREQYNFAKEYVQFIAENKEIIGEDLTMWTKPFAGMPAEEWKVPVNKPVYGPRYLAENIKSCQYSRLVMKDHVTGSEGPAQFYGTMAVDTKVQRLDAIPVNTRKSVFMGAGNF